MVLLFKNCIKLILLYDYLSYATIDTTTADQMTLDRNNT